MRRLLLSVCAAALLVLCLTFTITSTHAEQQSLQHSDSLTETVLASTDVPSSGRVLATPSKWNVTQPTYKYPRANDVARYQIVLWFSIIAACVAIAAVYSLAFMSFKKDTILYSSFNPNWGDRKR